MIIINSAAYVGQEFRNELGAIPPCLLPIGNRKLLQHQVETLRVFKNERIVVSLPSSYEITEDEKKLFLALNLEIILVPDGFSLAEALIYILNVMSLNEKTLRLLHGDTLIYDIPKGFDVIGVASLSSEYEWELDSKDDWGSSVPVVWAGFFSFSSQREFLRSLALSRGKFTDAVKIYSKEIVLKKEVCFDWFDLGHVNTYFASRAKITTQRVFNDLKIENGVVFKSGRLPEKISAEEFWFKNLPVSLKKFIPQLIEGGTLKTKENFYSLEYLPCLPLNEIFVHGRNPETYWARRFLDIRNIFNLFGSCFQKKEGLRKEIERDAIDLYVSKTKSRLKQINLEGFLLAKEDRCLLGKELCRINEVADECIRLTLLLPVVPSIIHGDLCFSNILFDSRLEAIKLIDPRGMANNGKKTIYGDQKYDLAKLAHSVIGLYDFIISGRYSIKLDEFSQEESIDFNLTPRVKSIQEKFITTRFIENVSVLDVMPIVVLLFLTMIPLHSDRPDRQKAMLLNAIRLYSTYVDGLSGKQ